MYVACAMQVDTKRIHRTWEERMEQDGQTGRPPLDRQLPLTCDWRGGVQTAISYRDELRDRTWETSAASCE